MKPCENVIVTVLLGKEGIDMELPSFLQINELKGKICETLASYRPGAQLRPQETALFFDDVELTDDACLASCGVWDGSIIQCASKVGGR